MVISKNGSAIHPCIKEVIFVTNVSEPNRELSSKRFCELPSLRYGPMGAKATTTGPLTLIDNASDIQISRERKYSWSNNDLDKDRPIRPPRRVRFTLPPPDGATDTDPPRRRQSDVGVGSRDVNTKKATPAAVFSQRPIVAATRNITSGIVKAEEKRVEKPPPRRRKSLARRFEKFRHHHQAKRGYESEAVEVPVSVSPGVRDRVHPTGRYVRGTLSPTSNQGPQEPPLTPGGLALLGAARDGDDQALRDLLRRALAIGISDTDLNATDSSGRTILSYVASNGSFDLLELILQLPGLDPNKPDNEGNTPLHFAAQAGQVECLNCLASRCRGVEIDARNNLGFTPLMKAALQGRNKCAKLLLFAGANPTLRDNGRGFRADQWARFCGRYVCADVIEKHARQRLLERSTSYGHWGIEHEMGARVVMGKVVPIPPVPQPQSNGLKSKLKKVFRTSSGPSSDTFSSARLVTQLTSAALCASSPVLPSSGSVPPVIKSLIRPLTVPRLQITLVNNNGDYPNCNLENAENPDSQPTTKSNPDDKIAGSNNKENAAQPGNGVVVNGKNEAIKPCRSKKKK
ncbi:ankyrin repeat domain-containing protein 33B-like [Sitophilus oryzae]|uniref:Ankyrin repeat domain-containing protein 33B-like n=1 Tax=Sitophilus oryzae TaxID=7048 RepID=A0A6J2X6Q6_SITOR|nr:ankyrin repeat domain-containing protein 33B-like [Sitophilus oryzae]